MAGRLHVRRLFEWLPGCSFSWRHCRPRGSFSGEPRKLLLPGEILFIFGHSLEPLDSLAGKQRKLN